MNPPTHAGERAPELDRRAEAVLFGLALLMAPVVVIQVTASDPVVLFAAETANVVIWLAFAAELVYLLARSQDRRSLLRDRWLDVAIVVLAPPVFVPAELATLRVLRLLRLVRLVAVAARMRRSTARVLGTEGLLYVGFVVCLVIFVGGVTLYELEPETVPTVWEGFWFILVTLTTVGYGDVTPKTFEGRAIAAVAMLIGLGAFATLTASMAQVLFPPSHSQTEQRLSELERRVSELHGEAPAAPDRGASAR